MDTGNLPTDLSPLVPILVSFSAALVCLGLEKHRTVLVIASSLAHVVLLVSAFVLLRLTLDGEVLVHAFSGWAAPVGIVFAVDAFSAVFLAISVVVFAAAATYFFLDDGAFGPRALALMFLLETGVAGALCTGDLFNFYVFFELLSITSFALVAYQSGGLQLEATLKFAVLSLLVSALLIAGVAALYAQTGRLTLAALHDTSAVVTSPPLYLFAVGLVITAMALKAAIVPLHFWLPDAHSMAPTAVSVVLSGVVVKVGAYGIFRLLASSSPWVGEEVRPVLLVAGAFTAVFAALLAVGQRDLKRLLAYSTASQMGYIVAAGSLGTTTGVAAALVFVVAHSLHKGTLFVIAGTLIATTGERCWERMSGMLRTSPWLAAATLVAAFSLAGLPPFAGFAGKLAVFTALVDTRSWWTMAALLIASVLLVYLMARVWLGIFGGTPPEETLPRNDVAPAKVALSCVLAVLVVAVGVGANPVVHAAGIAAAQLGDGNAYRDAVLASHGNAQSGARSELATKGGMPGIAQENDR